MMLTLFKHFSLIILTGLFLPANATHNRAGEITYTWLYGYTYKVKLTTYTNIGGTTIADRCFDTLSFGDGTGAVVPRTNGTTTALCSTGSATAYDGVILTPTIKKNEYETTHTFPGTGSYKISATDPNRNAGIINIANSVNQVFYVESYLVITAFGGPNSSPVLTFPPIDMGCQGQCFYHNPGAYDSDGDSLSYEMTYCRGTGGIACPGYTDPAGTIFGIDALTGTLTWCSPASLGPYNMAILIKEWRSIGNTYVMVGSVIRDMQVDVGSCNNTPPQINPGSLPDHYILATTNITSTVTATDSEGNLASLSAQGEPFGLAFGPATFNVATTTSSASGTFNWTTNYSHVRKTAYQVTVKASDNGNVNLVNFNTFKVKVIPHPPIDLVSTAATNFIRLNWKKPLQYDTTGNNPFLRYRVYRKTGSSSWVHAYDETIPRPATGYTWLGYTTNSISDTLFFDFNAGNPFPVGQVYSYAVIAEYADGATSYVSNQASNEIFVGMKELSLNDDVVIFPNPAADRITISFEKEHKELYSAELFDVSGKKIKTVSKEELSGAPLQLKLNDIAPGIYMLVVTGDHQTITKKIIKQ